MANFLNAKFNLPHIVSEAIFSDYNSLYKRRLDAHQYETIMEQLRKIEGPLLADRLSLFVDYDQNKDGFVSIDELTVQFTLFRKKARKYFPPGSIYTAKYIVKTFDLNRDNKLSFLDFNHCLAEIASEFSG